MYRIYIHGGGWAMGSVSYHLAPQYECPLRWATTTGRFILSAWLTLIPGIFLGQCMATGECMGQAESILSALKTIFSNHDSGENISSKENRADRSRSSQNLFERCLSMLPYLPGKILLSVFIHDLLICRVCAIIVQYVGATTYFAVRSHTRLDAIR